MNLWIVFFLGMFVAWVLIYLIDHFFWGLLRTGSKEVYSLRSTATKLKSRKGDLEADNLVLQSHVRDRKDQVDELTTKLRLTRAKAKKNQRILRHRAAKLNRKQKRKNAQLFILLQRRDKQLKQLSSNLDSERSESRHLLVKLTNQEKSIKQTDSKMEQQLARISGYKLSLRDTEDDLMELNTTVFTQDNLVDTVEVGNTAVGVNLSDGSVIMSELSDESVIYGRSEAKLYAELQSRDDELLLLRAEVERLQGQTQTDKQSSGEVTPDDLTKIWGIGPKIAKLLNNAHIHTFSDLANTPLEDINNILNSEGKQFKLANADDQQSWVDQAEQAAKGRWDEVEALRKQNAVRESKSGLTKIWGIGGKLEAKLHSRGVESYRQLANSTTSQVDDVLEAASGYYPEMGKQEIHQAWARQAQMADQQQWGQLRGYQRQFKRQRSRDDLKQIWGIGKSMEKWLNRKGVDSFSDLAAMSVEQLASVFTKADNKLKISLPGLYESWIDQARLAGIHDTSALQALQQDLSWGENLGDA